MANRWIFLLFFSFLPEFRMHFKQHSVCIQKGGGGGVEKGQGLKGVIPNELLYLDLHKTQKQNNSNNNNSETGAGKGARGRESSSVSNFWPG